MSKDTTILKSWQILFYARKHLGRSVLYSIFGKRHARTVDLWCEDPRFTAKEERAFDPIQGVKDLLDLLDDHGHCGTVRAALQYLSSGTACRHAVTDQVIDPLPSMTEEILADYRAVASLQRAIENDEDLDQVEARKRDAIAEIERTVAKYRKDIAR